MQGIVMGAHVCPCGNRCSANDLKAALGTWTHVLLLLEQEGGVLIVTFIAGR
jgi:hypothetical protein